MNLKKTDKIIAAIGVIILIVAVIAILLYIETDDPDNGNGDEPLSEEFEVSWKMETKSMKVKGYTSSTPYTDPIDISVESGCVITDAEFVFAFNDETKLGKIVNKGADTLTVKISHEDEGPDQISRTGAANVSLGTIELNSAPMNEPIDNATDIFDAEEIIKAKYINKNSATFDVKVKWEKGESLLTLRPRKLLNYFKDKGNNFRIYVTYTYYSPEIIDINNPDDDGEGDGFPPMNGGYTGQHGEYYRDTSRGRDI